jgi:hypothetical protein
VDPLENLLRSYGLELVVVMIALVLATLLGRVIYFGVKSRKPNKD